MIPNQSTSIKEINQLRILNLLRLYPDISRIEIVNQTGLGKATVSTLISEFINEGIVYEGDTGVQLGPAGRRPVQLRLNGQMRLAVGVELNGSECIAALTDLYCNPLRVVRYPTPDVSVEASVKIMVQTVNELLSGYDPAKLLGIGVGVPGPVDAARQRVIQAENIGWFDVPLGPRLTAQLNKPVMVMKRQNVGAVGEYWYGIGKDSPNLSYISIGVGISCGTIINGKLYEGASGIAGEMGHITVVPNGYPCKCGNYGCLETVASCPAIVMRVREKIKTGRETRLVEMSKGLLQAITGDMVIQAALQGDALAIEVIQEAAGYLGTTIASVINLLNPSMIIIGGELAELGDLFLDPIREVVRRQAFSISLATVKIVPSSLGSRAAAIGAAALVIDQFFTLAI